MINILCLNCRNYKGCDYKDEYQNIVAKTVLDEVTCERFVDGNQNSTLTKYSEETLKEILIHVIGTLGTTNLVISLNPKAMRDLFNTEWVGMYRFCKIVHDEDQPENIVIFKDIRTPFNKLLNIVAFDLLTKENVII